MPFRFSLQEVLDYRQHLVEQRQAALEEVREELQRVRDAMDEARATQRQYRIEMDQRNEDPRFGLANRELYLRYFERLRQFLRDSQAQLKSLQARFEKRRQELTEALQELEVMQELRKEEQRQYLIEERRQEARDFDEIAIPELFERPAGKKCRVHHRKPLKPARRKPRKAEDTQMQTTRIKCLTRSFLLALSLAGIFSLPNGPTGTACAEEDSQQKQVEDSATQQNPGRPAGIQEGMDALRELLQERRVSLELQGIVRDLEKDFSDWERDLERREKALELVQSNVEQNLARLEVARKQLERLTREIDEAREKELQYAAEQYKALQPEDAATLFNQMDLEFVAPVLRRMDNRTAGKILTAMVQETRAEDMEDSARQERLTKLKNLGEFLIDPKLVESARVSAGQPTSQ